MATRISLSVTACVVLAATPLAAAQANRGPQQLQELIAPIALFPDPLLAQVLAASNYTGQLHQAREWVVAGGVSANAQGLQWPASVQTLVNLPDLLTTLDNRREWLLSVNQAANNQGPALLAAAQALRQRASRNGALVNSAAVNIVTSGAFVLVEPADAARIPVPTYNPQQVFGSGDVPASAISWRTFLPSSAVIEPIGIDWQAGRLTNGFGSWYQGEIGRDDRGNRTASGTYYIAGSRPGYDGVPWRPSGTVVYPGSISTQGHPLEPAPWLPPVAPSAPLTPARPVAPVQPVAPVAPLRPHAPVQPTSFVPPSAPLRPISPVPSNIPGVYSPLPWGISGYQDGSMVLGNADDQSGAFSPGAGGWRSSVRSGATFRQWQRAQRGQGSNSSQPTGGNP